MEDVALVLGQAVDQALGTRKGIVRTGFAYVPMDEALAFVAILIFPAGGLMPLFRQTGTHPRWDKSNAAFFRISWSFLQ